MALYLVVNEAGEFLCQPEANRYGCLAKLKRFRPEWGSFDHAARFHSVEVAMLAGIDAADGRTNSIQVISLQDAWRN